MMNSFIPLHEELFSNPKISQEHEAIVSGEETLSFGELDRISSNLAWDLHQLGAGKGTHIGILLNPSSNLAVSVLAVLKTGAAYIPLSPAFPGERISYMMQDAGAGLLITDNSLPQPQCPPGTQVLIPDWSGIRDPLNDKDLVRIPVQSRDLAYILYTSGSTGNPKGVMIDHGNLSYYVHWFFSEVMPATGVGLPLTSSFIFAAAVTQFYSTLLSGRTLHILDPLMIRQPSKLMEWYSSHPGLGLYCVPTLWSEILHYLETSTNGSTHKKSLPVVYLSGESVSDELIQRSFNLLPSLQLWNLYGPTEATANLTSCRLYPGEPAHIGKALSGTLVFVVDENQNPVTAGQTGELIAAGPGIAQGYRNMPELTASTFIERKMNGGEILRLYRSGDLVREDAAGNLHFVGRRDQQVKIRGFRIELPEVEHALALIPAVKHAVVKVVSDRLNGKRLIAYLVFNLGQSIPVHELRKMLLNSLPDFMIPEVFVSLDSMPQLPNGKIDRKSLPLPGIQRPDLGYPAIPPVNADEKLMARIWEEVLGLEGIGMDDNFFDLGGNSLKANALVIELNSRFGQSMQIKSVFDNPTPSGLLLEKGITAPATETVTASKDKESEQNVHAGSGSVDQSRPLLSENQKALQFIHQTEAHLAAYNIFYSIRLNGALDIECLEKALQEIVRKHECLRMTFPSGKNESPVFANVPASGVLEIFDTGPGRNAIPEASALEEARKAASEPLDLESGHLYRFLLFELDRNTHVLFFIVHHIVFDGFSFEVFIEDLSIFYEQAKSGTKVPHTRVSKGYLQFCLDERDYLGSEGFAEDREYWKQQLAQVPTLLEIPTDYTRPESFAQEGGQVRRKMGAALRMALKNQGDKLGASMYMTCLAAFSVLLCRHTGRNDFLIGTPVANRRKKDFLSAIGYFVNTMLFRVTLDPALTFTNWLMNVKESILQDIPHSRFPFTRMSEILRTERIPGINPFFQIMFAYHETNWDFTTEAGLTGIAREEFTGNSKFDLFAEIFSDQEDAEIVFTYSKQLYHPDTMETLADHFVQVLEHVSVSPGTTVSKLSLISTREFNRIVYEWNETAFNHEEKGTIADLIFKQIVKTPGLPALVSRQEVITYSEMGSKTDVITANLRRLGVQRGDPVGLHLENSPNMVICILAVFNAGAIYIPLDPYYPEERLKYVIEKTRIRFLIVDKERVNRKKELSEQIITVDELLDETIADHLTSERTTGVPSDLAYIMFTSGSTGNPKGVMIGHDSLLNFIIWMKMEIEAGEKDTFLSTTSINFDISFLELFTPLISGASLVLEKRSELQAPERIEAILNEMKVNTVQFVPSALKALCDAGVLKRAKFLTTIISGGEKLSKTLQEQIFSESGARLINLYGPTEATVYMGCWHCSRNSPLRMVPIGYPIFNSAFYILNENLEPVPIGVTGEVYLGGHVLAEGYFEDPIQTAARFIPNPVGEEEGSKIYRTGDLGRYLWDGAVEFLGRTDQQVKVRGFRIELGEVETLMLRFPGIRRVVVHAQEQKEEDIRLTAFIVPEPGAEIKDNELREFLKLHLPAYMIPGNFIVAHAIPTLPNGKTDFRALVHLRPQTPKIPDFLQHHMNETEAALKAIWKEILDHEAFSLKDNFFEVGGHSLLLVKMKDLIEEKLKTEISIVDLFKYPTIRTLAAFIRKDQPDYSKNDIATRVAMRNKHIKQQINKRIFPDNN